MADKDQIDFSAEEHEFPSSDIEEWQFFVAPSDEQGQSDPIQARVPSALLRQMSEIIQKAMMKGYPIKTPSDFLRFAVFRAVNDMHRLLKMQDNESMSHFLLRQKESMKISQQTDELNRVTTVTNNMLGGLRVLVAEDSQDWKEARDRITSYLIPIMSMAGDQDLLMRMYIRALFRNKGFQSTLEKIAENVRLGNVIENAQKAYDQIVETGKKVG
tara:strand:+ start:207 stop:851 length:645 start_codon:yes stop_codon:yes gene_type:complete